MLARIVTTSLVTKGAGIAAGFVTLVTKGAVVTKRAATMAHSVKRVCLQWVCLFVRFLL